jgi:hypothetical protein
MKQLVALLEVLLFSTQISAKNIDTKSFAYINIDVIDRVTNLLNW